MYQGVQRLLESFGDEVTVVSRQSLKKGDIALVQGSRWERNEHMMGSHIVFLLGKRQPVELPS